MKKPLKSPVLFSSIWPISSKSLTYEILSKMPERELWQLKRAIYKREFARSGSHAFAKRKIRELRLKLHPYSAPKKMPLVVKASRYKECHILDSLVPKRERLWTTPIKRVKSGTHEISNFSLIDNPEETFGNLKKIAQAECAELEATLNFQDEKVIDIGAFLVLRVMHERMLPFIRGGKMNESVKKVIEAVGLREGMRIVRFTNTDMSDVFPFPLHQRLPPEKGHFRNIALEPSTREKASDNLVNTINKWLSNLDEPEQLTKEGCGFVTGLLGEVLNNAERHSNLDYRMNGNWYTAGFMAKRRIDPNGPKSDTNAKYVCHLAFLSVGKTISETIQTADENIVEAMAGYVNLHRNKHLSEESLRTVYALQDGISRTSQSDDSSINGVGMLDIVDLVNELSNDGENGNAALTIVSGKTCIILKDKYRSFDWGDDNKRRQFLNEQNDINQPPDPDCIVELKQKFPGVVISVRFELEQTKNVA
ncbi:hypothetical protein [Kordiimonas sp.]|uniref:hypothetical protein n=1 Tax=Kordiimonas sp. TaxID=1970157 RepID=UPI003A900829